MSKVSFSSSARALSSFASRVTAWQKKHGRHDLPWQNTRDPYRIWLSEIMLQQTQVDTVMNYYARFLEAFPDVTALARAPIAQVLALWSGLGYYRRAHHLHEAAKIIAQMGAFPDTQETLMDLPGVGRSTAAAIAVFAFNRRAAIMDGNVRRVLTRHQNIVDHRGKDTDPALWAKAESLLPRTHLVAYTQGMMDLGATVCKRTSPKCSVCPVAQDCGALAENRAEVLPPSRAPKVEERAFWLWVIRHKEHLLF
ncbi:MAG: A/G-specific adenine glycosylase, partial [Burkholderiales bacterium]|nr:A/G-specific adenine glycosylase [Burkholderiales bacterium]